MGQFYIGRKRDNNAYPIDGQIKLKNKDNLTLYRVFIKYCVFYKELSKVYHLSLASTRLLLLVVQKITSQ